MEKPDNTDKPEVFDHTLVEEPGTVEGVIAAAKVIMEGMPSELRLGFPPLVPEHQDDPNTL